jgi:Arc/MetJ family transcription regulator
MRTNIVLDDERISRAKRLTGHATKRAVVDEALELLIRVREQEAVRTLRGKLVWDGDLGRLREARSGPAR